jgi:hypothetical protein
MPKKKEPDLTPEEQFKRFQEAANEHEIEKRLPDIEERFKKLVPEDLKHDNRPKKT